MQGDQTEKVLREARKWLIDTLEGEGLRDDQSPPSIKRKVDLLVASQADLTTQSFKFMEPE